MFSRLLRVVLLLVELSISTALSIIIHAYFLNENFCSAILEEAKGLFF